MFQRNVLHFIVKAPEPAPVPEVPKDPATAPIGVNKETLIEVHAEKKPLGILVVKGDSSTVQVIFFSQAAEIFIFIGNVQ